MLLMHLIGDVLFGRCRWLAGLLTQEVAAHVAYEHRLQLRPVLRDVLALILYCTGMALSAVFVMSFLVGMTEVWRALAPGG